MEKIQITANVTEQEKELFNLVLSKANLEENKVLRTSMKKFIIRNLELLTNAEIKKYEDLLVTPKSIKK